MWSGPVGRSPVSIRKRAGSLGGVLVDERVEDAAAVAGRRIRRALVARPAERRRVVRWRGGRGGRGAGMVVLVDMVSPVVVEPTGETAARPGRAGPTCEEPPVGGSGYRVGSMGRLSWAATTRGSVRRSNSCHSGYATRTRSAIRVTHRLGCPATLVGDVGHARVGAVRRSSGRQPPRRPRTRESASSIRASRGTFSSGKGIQPAKDVVVPPRREVQAGELRVDDLSRALATEEPVPQEELRRRRMRPPRARAGGIALRDLTYSVMPSMTQTVVCIGRVGDLGAGTVVTAVEATVRDPLAAAGSRRRCAAVPRARRTSSRSPAPCR